MLSMLLAVTSLKLIAEVALMALMGQWLLGLLAGDKRDRNLFYQLLQIVTRPFLRLARLLTPPTVLDRHVPVVAFLLLAIVWLGMTFMKIRLCLQIGVTQC